MRLPRLLHVLGLRLRRKAVVLREIRLPLLDLRDGRRLLRLGHAQHHLLRARGFGLTPHEVHKELCVAVVSGSTGLHALTALCSMANQILEKLVLASGSGLLREHRLWCDDILHGPRHLLARVIHRRLVSTGAGPALVTTRLGRCGVRRCLSTGLGPSRRSCWRALERLWRRRRRAGLQGMFL